MENHIRCLVTACERRGIMHEFIDKEKNFIRVDIGGQWQYFQLNRTPFNTEVVSGLCKDKMHTYALLKSVVRMPRSLSFLDFDVDDKYKAYRQCRSTDEAIREVEQHFTYPVVVKCNKGALGVNVYLCESREAVTAALGEIFNRQSMHYDYVAIVQEFIPTIAEYRLICVNGYPQLAYKRGNACPFNARYWDRGEHAVLISEQALYDDLYHFVKPVFGQIDIGFVGFDIIRDTDNRLCLIELNSSPRFDHLIDAQGDECVIELYANALQLMQNKSE